MSEQTGQPIQASDLVGCRYRLVQRRAHPDVPATPAAQARAERADAARAAVLAHLPGPSKNFRCLDLDTEADRWEREMATLEAMATGAHLITHAAFAYDTWQVDVDALVREGDAYLPLLITNHRVARRVQSAGSPSLPAVPTHRVGLSAPLELPYRLRHHSVDGYRLGMAARALEASDLDAGRGLIIGQDRDTAFYVDTQSYQPALERALEAAAPANLPTSPRRLKECADCRFWHLCEPVLRARDDISLFLPGDRGTPYVERGIGKVQELIDASLGEVSALAQAWRDGTVLLKRPEFVAPPRADVEVDIDMEAYLDQGAYLWGAWHAGEYTPFVTWAPLGGQAEAHNVAAFWQWLMQLREDAHAQGRTFAAYCYSAHGENHWLRMSAQRFGTPSPQEVAEFIASPEWVDMFSYVKRGFAGPHGLGLKLVAPQAGHAWAEDDFDGEESVNARRLAVAGDQHARQRLLDYNAGDVQATARIREWMSQGAPGVAELG
ncbi:TM0106 family RecB-like putative nuclease [Corynebacterium lizhenjunii]|uniref:TM0106 family RecB-like putative nuclease n=1 Tax=Corynebacterium lizhenjunii TaxID=2709394 RepID=UPI001FD59F11|nr:TM0106 family RecB-like putative nuclease [Corynebacterium lizhenjunii]